MRANQISLLLVDDNAETRASIKRLLQFEMDFVVVGEADNGQEAYDLVKNLQPDCILMDINMPVMDGIEATELITHDVPNSVIIIISVQGEHEYLRKAMVAGARDYLSKPFSSDELINTIRQAYENEQTRQQQQAIANGEIKDGKVITVFSAKGGVGKTTIATNIAVSLGKQGYDTVLMDLDLQFGDVPIMLDLKVKRSMANWYSDGLLPVTDYLQHHEPSGIRVLAAPESLEDGELITAEHVTRMITEIRAHSDYLLIDTPQFFHETTLQSLELADEIILVATPDLPNLKNVRRCLDVLTKLELVDKVKVVANKVGKDAGIPYEQFDSYLNYPVWEQIPNEPRLIAQCATQGIPVVVLQPKAKISQKLTKLSQRFEPRVVQEKEQKKLPFFKMLAAKKG